MTTYLKKIWVFLFQGNYRVGNYIRLIICLILSGTEYGRCVAQDSTAYAIQNDKSETHSKLDYNYTAPQVLHLADSSDTSIITIKHFSPIALSPLQIKKRTQLAVGTNIIVYGTAMVGLYSAWYKNYPQSKFHTFNDIGEWNQMDKFGHMYSAYAESKVSMELWRWTGIDRKKRIWLGGMSGAMYQTVIEVLDGFSAEWGWSWGDFAANIAGSGLLVSQELAWDEQRIQMKWSFHRKKYEDQLLQERSNVLFGKSNPERFLKDYNGQTYWLSVSPKSFFPHSNYPAWLQISVGVGAEGLFGGRKNIAFNENGNVNFDRRDISRTREWFIAPDINLTKIKTNKRGIKLAFQILNVFKFPTPSIGYSGGKLNWNWIHF